METFTDRELREFLIKNKIIDYDIVQAEYEMQKRKELLAKHTYRIYQGGDGYWYTYLPNKDKGRIKKKRNSKKEIEDLVIAFWKEQLENPTIEDVFEEWIQSKLDLKEISKATYDRYKIDFDRFFYDFRNNKVKYVTETEIEDFMKRSIAGFNLSAKAFSNLRTLIFGIFKRAKKKKYIDFSITNLVNDMEINKKIFKKTIKEDYEEVFMEDEELAVINYLENNQDILNLGILLMFKTGMRVGELVAIKFSDINDNIIRVHRTEIRYKGENGKTVFEVRDMPKTEAGIRDVIVPKDYTWILDEMRRLNPEAEYILTKDGSRVRTYSIGKRLKNVCRKNGVHEKSTHKIRKTYCSILLDNNVDKALVISQMGHTDIACSEKHYHRNRRRDEQKAAIFDNIPELQSCRTV